MLFIQIDTNKVDVNIHPTKTEVKFEDEKLLYNLMNSSVSKSLGSYHIIPSLDFNADINFDNKVVVDYDKKNTITLNQRVLKTNKNGKIFLMKLKLKILML